MNNKLRIAALPLFFAVASIPNLCFATDITAQGLVDSIRTHDATAHPDWAPPRFWFTLKNVTAPGNCPTIGGLVLFVANDVQAYAMVMKAQSAGKALTVATDDAVRTNSWCSAKYVTIQY